MVIRNVAHPSIQRRSTNHQPFSNSNTRTIQDPNPRFTHPTQQTQYPTPRYPSWVRNSLRVAALACHQPPNQKPKRQVPRGLARNQAAASAMATTAGPAATPGHAGRRRRPATRGPPWSRGQVNLPKKVCFEPRKLQGLDDGNVMKEKRHCGHSG